MQCRGSDGLTRAKQSDRGSVVGRRFTTGSKKQIPRKEQMPAPPKQASLEYRVCDHRREGSLRAVGWLEPWSDSRIALENRPRESHEPSEEQS